jgi:hypothetical protein
MSGRRAEAAYFVLSFKFGHLRRSVSGPAQPIRIDGQASERPGRPTLAENAPFCRAAALDKLLVWEKTRWNGGRREATGHHSVGVRDRVNGLRI